MKIFLILVIFYVIKTRCYHFPEIKSVAYHVPIVTFKGISKALIYIRDDDTDESLINSILLDLYNDQPVVLLKGDNEGNFKKAINNKHRKVIILTKILNMKDLVSYSFKQLFLYYWSPVFIVITSKNGNETCLNGTINKEFFESAKDYMNSLWRKYRVVRVTILFPYFCPHHYIIYGDKKLSHKTIYDRSATIINPKNDKELQAAVLKSGLPPRLSGGYPLRASMFHRFPTSIRNCTHIYSYINPKLEYSHNFCGLDGLVFHDYMRHFNFKLIAIDDPRCNSYGFEDSETHLATGSLDCIVREQVDISFNSRFLVQYTEELHLYYLHYISNDQLCVIMKRPELRPLWHYPNILGNYTGLKLLFLIGALGVLTWITALLGKKYTGAKQLQIHAYLINSLTNTLFGISITKSLRTRFRILTGTSLISSIIVLGVFQGNVNNQFTTRTRYKEIKTLDELYASSNMLFTSPEMRDILKHAESPTDEQQKKYLRSLQIKNDSFGLDYLLKHSNTATLWRKADVLIEIILNHTDSDGTPKLFVVDECFAVYYLSYISRSGFLFVEESLKFMMRLLEAGLPNKYYTWTRRKFSLADTNPQIQSEPRPFSKTKLSHLRVSFGILGLGLLVSTITFFMEKWKAGREL